ncbi:MAG: phosphate ABC transporter substrate-binding protein [Christensenellales bacterium]
MKRKLLATMGLVVASMMVFAGCGAGNSAAGGNEKLMVIGSTSVEPLMQKFIDTYTTADVEMQAPGSSQGIAAAQDGTADIGMSSRELKDSETGLDATTIAYDGIVAVVNPNCPVNDLTKDQLAKIFKGEIKNWKEVGGPDKAIAVFYREAGSGTRGAFEELLGLENVDESFVAGVMDATSGVIQSVKGNDAAIGYISYGSMSADVKALKVDGVECTPETVKDKTYAIARPFLLVTKQGTDNPAAKAFIDYILSDAGQKIVTDSNYVSVK